MEQSIKSVLVKQTIAHQQQQLTNLQVRRPARPPPPPSLPPLRLRPPHQVSWFWFLKDSFLGRLGALSHERPGLTCLLSAQAPPHPSVALPEPGRLLLRDFRPWPQVAPAPVCPLHGCWCSGRGPPPCPRPRVHIAWPGRLRRALP